MNSLQIKQYFESYVKNYKPYRNIIEYDKLIDTLINYYTDHSYNQINAPFKKAYEEQIIPKEFYNNLLLSIGFPEELIAKFTEKDKVILLSSFMDFNRYKGTIDQFQKIGYSFEEPLSIYELFIDYKEIDILYYSLTFVPNNNIIFLENQILYDALREYDKFLIDGVEYTIKRKVFDNDKYFVIIDKPYTGNLTQLTNFTIARWVFIPSNIYNYKDNKIIDTLFPYIDIYLGTYHYFVNIEELEGRRVENDIILPIKSNLIFIDYNRYKEINVFHNLLSAIFLKEYYNSRLTIFFKDGDYSITFGRLYKLWYYILLKFYNYDYIDVDISNFIMFDKDYYGFDYTISDIDMLNEKYNNINTANDYSKFYYEYISSKLTIPEHIARTVPLEDFEFIVRNEIGEELIDYVNNRINISSSDLEKYEYNFILDEIYNSVITWVMMSEDDNIKNNFEYITNNMTRISYSIDMSPSYNLIKFVKPYHVELISELTEYLKSDGNGNIVNTDMLFKMYIEMTQASVYTISEKILGHITIPTYDDISISTSMNFNLQSMFKHFVTVLSDYSRIKINYVEENNISVSTLKAINDIELIFKSIISVVQEYRSNITYDYRERLIIIEEFNKLLSFVNELTITADTLKMNFDLFSILKTAANIVDEFGQELLLNVSESNIIKTLCSSFETIQSLESDTYLNSNKFMMTINNIAKSNIDINYFIFFIDHLSSYLLIINSLVDIFIEYRIKMFQKFNTYQNILIDSKLHIFSFDEDTSLVVDHLPELNIIVDDDDTSTIIDNITMCDITLFDFDTSGYIDCHPEQNVILNNLNTITVFHTYNFI